ncbi:response regulator transcription factor [Isobaculum melis]|uniref:Transcriptional regulatory protein, C terminal n=1 Tax=Isobaculum melis TaxID=142588 RepID=A0A1H9UBD9_9LACT|nr:response regulator transcription factor [Isobaculum melis]SES06474.1 Transcriptional regulatory protein, C terminal [Isobaculum melis]
MDRILLVDDDPDYQLVIKELLELEGYEVSLAESAAQGLILFKSQAFDLVISDLKMVSIDGLQFLSLLRKADHQLKVIILTGSDDDDDEIKSIELNVNDYIKKTTSMKVLLKRIEKVLSEKNTLVEELFSESEKLRMDLRRRKVYKRNEIVELTFKEYELLLFFMQNKNTILSRERIIQKVWHVNEQYVDSRIVDTQIKRLRAKLRISCIYSIRGIGYEWFE